MKSTGIQRKVDDLGRVVIPAGIRRSLGIREGDALEVSVDGEHVILAKPVDSCVFCGADDGPLEPFRNRLICRPCVSSVGVMSDQLRRPAVEPVPAPAVVAAADGEEPPVRHLAPAPAPGADGARPEPAVDERAAGVRDERREPYDPASTTAW